MCVYYIQEEKTNNVKIGWCWNLHKRVQCLQIGNSQKLKVIKQKLRNFHMKENNIYINYIKTHILEVNGIKLTYKNLYM